MATKKTLPDLLNEEEKTGSRKTAPGLGASRVMIDDNGMITDTEKDKNDILNLYAQNQKKTLPQNLFSTISKPEPVQSALKTPTEMLGEKKDNKLHITASGNLDFLPAKDTSDKKTITSSPLPPIAPTVRQNHDTVTGAFYSPLTDEEKDNEYLRLKMAKAQLDTAKTNVKNAINHNIISDTVTNAITGTAQSLVKLGENIGDMNAGLKAVGQTAQQIANQPKKPTDNYNDYLKNGAKIGDNSLGALLDANKQMIIAGTKGYQDSVMQDRLGDEMARQDQLRMSLESKKHSYLYNQFQQAAYSTGQMTPTLIMGALTNGMGLTGAVGEAVGLLPIAITSHAEYTKNALQSMQEQNAKREAEGMEPKFSDEDMMKRAAAAGFFGVLIEAVGEELFGGVLGRGQGMLDNVLANIPGIRNIAGAASKPVARALWTFITDSFEEGAEEVLQGIAQNFMVKALYDDSETVFKGKGREYLDSFVVGTLMGASGRAPQAVRDSVGGAQIQYETSRYVKAADSVTSKEQAADVVTAITSHKARNEAVLQQIQDEYGKKTPKEVENMKAALEWQNEQLDRVVDILENKNTQTDIIENNKIRNGNEDVTSLRTGIEQYYSENGAQKAETDLTETRRQRQEKFDLQKKINEAKQTLQNYGITDMVIDDTKKTFTDTSTGEIHVGINTPTEELLNIKIGHELVHQGKRGDTALISDIIAAMRSEKIDVDSLISETRETYINFFKRKGMTQEQAEKIVSQPQYIEEEVAAEFIGKLNSRKALIDNLAKRNQSTLAKIYDTVMKVIDTLTGNDPMKRQYQNLAKQIRATLKANGYDISEKTSNDNPGYSNDTRYFVRKENGEDVVVIEENFLKGVKDKKQWPKIIREKLTEKFKDGIKLGNSIISVTSVSKREVTHNKKSKQLMDYEPQTYSAKVNASTQADELLGTATGWIDEEPNHERNDNITDFSAGKVIFEFENEKYSAEIIVSAKSNNHLALYDIRNIKKIKETEAHTAKSQVRRYRESASISDDIIPQNEEYVNTKFRLDKPVEETKNLIAVHNLSVPKLLDSIELGGFPSPSIAIVKADQGHTGYGPISVIFRKNTIDPARSSQNKVYGGDAYTPTSSNARTDYQIDNNEVRKFDRMVFAASKEYADGKLSKSSSFDGFLSGNSDMTSESPERIAMHLNNEPAVIIAYAKDKGLSLPDPVMNAEFKGRYSNEYYQKVLDKIGIVTAVDMFERSEGEGLTEEDKETLRSIFNEHNAEKLENNSVFKRKFDTEEKKKAFLNAKSSNLNFYAIIRDLMNFAGSSEKGEVDTYETTKTLRNAFKESDVEEWILDKIEPAYVGKGIYNGADPYTRSGNRKSFGQTHLPYTAENIVKMMNKSNEKAEGMFGSLVNMVMAASSENFSSVEGIHKAENRLQMEDEGAYNQRKTDLQNSLNEVIDTVMEENEIEYDYDTQNDIEETIVKAAGKAKTAASIVTEFKKAGYKISSETASDLLSLFKTARNFSTGYFEAKPQRVVDLSEIASVVLPEGLNDSVYKTLDDNRIGYKTYESGNDQQRLDVINSIEDIRFRVEDDDNVSRETEKQSGRKRKLHATGSRKDIEQKANARIADENEIIRYVDKDLSKLKGKVRENAIDRKLRYWDTFKPDDKEAGAPDFVKEKLAEDYSGGLFGDPSDILAQAQFMKKLSDIGSKEDKERFANFMLSADAKITVALRKIENERAAKLKEEQRIQQEIEYERAAREFMQETEAPLPGDQDRAYTDEELTTTEYGEAPETGETYLDSLYTELGVEEEERQAAREAWKERAAELAERFGIETKAPTPEYAPPEGVNAEEANTEDIDIPRLDPAKEESVSVKKSDIRRSMAEVKIADAMREYDHQIDLIHRTAESRRQHQTSKLYDTVYQKVYKSLKKLMPSGTMKRAAEYEKGATISADYYQEREDRIKTARKTMNRVKDELYDVDTDTNYLDEWKYADDERKKQLEKEIPALSEYAKAEREYKTLSTEKSRQAGFSNKVQEMYYQLSKLLDRPQHTIDITGETYGNALNLISSYVDEIIDENKDNQELKKLTMDYFQASPEDRASVLEEHKESKGAEKQLTKMLEAYSMIFDETAGIDDQAAQIAGSWAQFEKDTIENSSKLRNLKASYEAYQADIDSARFHLGKDLTEADLQKIRDSIDEKKEKLRNMEENLTDADYQIAKAFMETADQVSEQERRTDEFMNAYAVAEMIASRDSLLSEMQEDETAAERLEKGRRHADEELRDFMRDHEKEMQAYISKGYTAEEAAILVRKDNRLAQENRLREDTALERLGYKIAGAVRNDYWNAQDIIEREHRADDAMKAIRKYVKANSVNVHVESIAKDVAKGNMTILESGMTGTRLDQLRALSALYKTYYDYKKGGIKARKTAIAAELTRQLDAVFDGYDISKYGIKTGRLDKFFETAMTFANPENVMIDVFGDNEVGHYLADTYITPVIKNSASARRQTNKQVERLNSYHLTRNESALTQIVAEYASLMESIGDDLRPILNKESLVKFLNGDLTVDQLVGKLGLAEAGIAEADTKQKKTDAEYDEQDVPKPERTGNVNTEAQRERTSLEKTLQEIQDSAKAEKIDAAAVADKVFNAAHEMQDLMNEMYEAINEMYVTHGGKEMAYRKNYMPHQQPQDVQDKLNEVMRFLDMDKVTEIPTAIKGRTEEFRPYAKWLSFRQQRKGNETVYDAVGNIFRYMNAANEAIYHIDDIAKLRHLESYIRNRYTNKQQKYEQLILDEIANEEVKAINNIKDDDTTPYDFAKFAQYLKLYTDDLAGKQVFRDTEKLFGSRTLLNWWAKILKNSNRVLLTYNISSAVKQLSQMPAVAAGTINSIGWANTQKAMEYALNSNNELNQRFQLEEKSTFLAEKLDRIEADYGDKPAKNKALDAFAEGLSQFDKLNSRFAVYAYFMRGIESGMHEAEALDYADRMARQLNASRMRGSQPLVFRNKGFLMSTITMYQRETLSQIEWLLKVLPRDYKNRYDRIAEEHGAETAKKTMSSVIAKNILGHQIAVGLFNTAAQAIGIGTPAMFDVAGTLLRSLFKNMLPDDDEEYDFSERLARVKDEIGDEIVDDIPIAGTFYDLFVSEDGGRLPIASINWRHIHAAFQNYREVKDLEKQIKKETDSITSEELEELKKDVQNRYTMNLVKSVIDVAGVTVTGGGQLRKTLTAFLDLLAGGKYNAAGNLQYALGAPEALQALAFGESSTGNAQEYYSTGRTLSANQTQAYKDITKLGMSRNKAYDVVREISRPNTVAGKEEALKAVKANMTQKATLYMDLIASKNQKIAVDNATVGASGLDYVNIVNAAQDLRNVKTTREKIGKLLDAGLTADQTESLYCDLIAEWENDDNGNRIRMKDADKLATFRRNGMNIFDYLKVKKQYQDINAMDRLSTSEKTNTFYKWLTDNYTEKKRDIAADTFVYYSSVPSSASTYKKYMDSGLSSDLALDIVNTFRGKTKAVDKLDALDDMKLTAKERDAALSVFLEGQTLERVRTGLAEGMKIQNYTTVRRADTDGNGSINAEERKAAIDKIPGLTDADRSVLWIATGGSAVNNPYEGTQKKQTGFGSGYGAGFGSGFGSGFGTGFGSGFGTSSNDDDPDGFLAAALNAYKK